MLYVVLFRIMMVAKKFASPGKRKMHFAVSDAGNFSAELNDLGLSYVNDTPVVVARDLSERRYVMQQPLTYVLIAYITAVCGSFVLFCRCLYSSDSMIPVFFHVFLQT